MHVDLEQARKRAKELVKSGRAAQLADAQREVARGLGYASWPALVHAVRSPSADDVVAAAYDRPDRALELLERAPELRDDPWVALSLGDASKTADAREPGGPLDAAPLFYVARSRIAEDAVPAARDLLRRGALTDGKTAESWTNLSVACSRGDAELVRVLLEAGADPNDNDSLYHSIEPADDACTRLLLEHGAVVPGTNALAHALDYDCIDRVRLLLEHGADPNEGLTVRHAVVRGRTADFVRLLAEHGADVSARDRGGRTAYAHAVLRGRDELAQELKTLGSPTDLGPDRLDDDARAALVDRALDGDLDAVVAEHGVGLAGGDPPGSLLHHASYRGLVGPVARLLELGADPNTRTTTYHATPLGWAAIGSRHHGEGDPVGVAKLLLGAGARLDAEDVEAAAGPLVGWLEDRIGGRDV